MSDAQKIPPIEMRLSSKKTFGPEDFALLEEACKTIQELKARESELFELVREARKIILADTLKRALHRDWLNRATRATELVLYFRRLGAS